MWALICGYPGSCCSSKTRYTRAVCRRKDKFATRHAPRWPCRSLAHHSIVVDGDATGVTKAGVPRVREHRAVYIFVTALHLRSAFSSILLSVYLFENPGQCYVSLTAIARSRTHSPAIATPYRTTLRQHLFTSVGRLYVSSVRPPDKPSPQDADIHGCQARPSASTSGFVPGPRARASSISRTAGSFHAREVHQRTAGSGSISPDRLWGSERASEGWAGPCRTMTARLGARASRAARVPLLEAEKSERTACIACSSHRATARVIH